MAEAVPLMLVIISIAILSLFGITPQRINKEVIGPHSVLVDKFGEEVQRFEKKTLVSFRELAEYRSKEYALLIPQEVLVETTWVVPEPYPHRVTFSVVVSTGENLEHLIALFKNGFHLSPNHFLAQHFNELLHTRTDEVMDILKSDTPSRGNDFLRFVSMSFAQATGGSLTVLHAAMQES